MSEKNEMPASIVGLLEMMAIVAVIDSVDESMREHHGDGNKLYAEEGIDDITGVMTAARARVKANLSTLDEAMAEGGPLHRHAGESAENRRLAENLSGWLEGFLVGSRYQRNTELAKAELAAEESK